MLRPLLNPAPYSTDTALLLIRLFMLFMVYYGYDKLVHFEEKAAYWPDPFHIGSDVTLALTITAELVCPVLVAAGFYTRIALVPAIVNMLFAIFIGHNGQPFMEREHAFSFLVPFVAIFLAGPGKFSLDVILRPKR